MVAFLDNDLSSLSLEVTPAPDVTNTVPVQILYTGFTNLVIVEPGQVSLKRHIFYRF